MVNLENIITSNLNKKSRNGKINTIIAKGRINELTPKIYNTFTNGDIKLYFEFRLTTIGNDNI